MAPNTPKDRTAFVWVCVALVAVAILFLSFFLGPCRLYSQSPTKAGISESSSTRAKVVEESDRVTAERLGEKLFNDPILSENGKVSCATCHLPDRGYSSGGLPPALGGGTLARRAPPVWNRAKGKSFFWDGRADSLEDQVYGPLTAKDEMGNKTVGHALNRINRIGGEYRKMFGEVYPQWGVTDFTLAMALAAYEKTLSSPKTRADDYLSGENKQTLNPAEARGAALFFGRARCYVCHSGPQMTDESFHNTGVGWDPDGRLFRDNGRYNVTRKDADTGKFKTPGLRGCKAAAPYMHDASLKTLRDVVEFYGKGGVRGAPFLDRDLRPIDLSGRDRDDLVAFLEVL
jgi:cytochrome c peroxidase